MSINIKTQKILSPSNVKKIIELGISLKDSLDVVNQKCVEEYDETRTYAPNMLCIYNDYIWKCKFTTTGVFNENKWDKLSDDLSLIDLDTIKNMVNLTDEEITNLQSLISTEIRLDKCFSSSDAYNRILNAENECKKFTLEQLAKKAGVVYKIVSDTTGVDSTEYLYLIPNGSNGYNIYAYIDGSAVKISDTNINLDGYAKLTDLDNYYDKATSDGKYATITTVDGKVDKTSILSAISDNPSDDKILSEKAINDTLVKKTDIATTVNSSSTDSEVPTAKSVYSAIDNVSGRLNKTTKFTKDSTSYATLEEFIKNHDFFKLSESSIYIFDANGFDDLPSTNWDYTIKMYNTNGAIHVVAYKFISDNEYFVRSFTYTGNWAGGWKRLCTTSVADVSLTSSGISFINNDTATGSVFYQVKNGYANVSINGITFTSGTSCEISGLPKPSQYIYNNLGYAGTVVGEVYANANDNTLKVVMPITGSTGYGFISYPVAES